MSTSPSSEPRQVSELPTGPELMDQIIQEPTLDLFLDRDPRAAPLSDQELMAVLLVTRKLRAQSMAKAETRKVKKQGGME